VKDTYVHIYKKSPLKNSEKKIRLTKTRVNDEGLWLEEEKLKNSEKEFQK
jgi:hypothetical protein